MELFQVEVFAKALLPQAALQTLTAEWFLALSASAVCLQLLEPCCSLTHPSAPRQERGLWRERLSRPRRVTMARAGPRFQQ